MSILEVEEAVQKLKDAVVEQEETTEVLLLDALGLIVAEDVIAVSDQPPFARSPLDGYALRAADIQTADKKHPVMLTVIDKIMAGQASKKQVGEKEAIRLMTGAPIPVGADCVIRQEDTDLGKDTVAVFQSLQPFENYCFQGEDYQAGSCLLQKGTRIRAAEIAVMASCGKEKVKVYSGPKVSLFSTGDEIVMPGEDLSEGKIYDTNLFYLHARLREMGVSVENAEKCVDDAVQVAEKIKQIAKTSSLILTTGGVSVGEKDIMHEVRKILHVEPLFWRVKIKPGSPTLAFVYEETLVICLTGNPFGVVANFELLVRPVLEKLSRGAVTACKRGIGILQNDFLKASHSRRIVRARYEDRKVFLPEGHASGMIRSMSETNCFLDIAAGTDELKKGDGVQIIIF